jgi:hypothetical protein
VNHPGFWPVTTDGQALAFRNDCFDAVICQLGLQFFRPFHGPRTLAAVRGAVKLGTPPWAWSKGLP